MINNIGLFRAIIRNINSKAMNREMIGYTLHRDYGPFSMDEINQYIDATEDDPSKYSQSTVAPPFFFSRELYPLFHNILTHKKLKINLLKMIHGQQSLKIYEPLRPDQTFSITVSIADIADTPAGELLIIKIEGTSKGKLILESDTGFLVRDTEKKKERSLKKEASPSPEKSDKNEVKFFIKTKQGQEKKYANVSKDHNPIHTNYLFARAAGFPGRILHGVCVMAMCSNSLVDEVAGRNTSRMREISGRFSFPVIPGDTLTLIGNRAKKGNLNEVHFNLYSSKNKIVINNGFFSYS
ncbi:MAG: MaoC family dehydratase N-terminal domain-containing protein [Spirochaetes bacterium]|nr:MaoC family dehydratase N-terminal domain-containing protein [Spirochaetota bacterium]